MNVQSQRDIALDALRGFAMLGIIIVNVPFFAGPLAQMPSSALDAAAFWFSTAFGMGKFFLIFSFLFGFGFSLMLSRAAADGRPLGPRFFRRLFALFLIGAAHAVLLFFGDILMLYALLGIVLWCCRNWSRTSLFGAAAAVGVTGLVLQASVLVLLSGAAHEFAAETQRTAKYLGSFWQVTSQRIVDLPDTLSFILVFNGFPALSMFFLGLALGRDRLFPPAPGSALFRHARRCLAIGAGVSGVAAFLAMIWADPQTGALTHAGTFATYVVAAAGPVLSFGMAMTLLDLFNSKKDVTLVRWLAITGSNSLTAYVLHSVLLAALFCGWGLGYYNSLGAAPVLAIGVLTWVAVTVLVNIWRTYFRYGPDEWLLRSITDLQWKPILNVVDAKT